MGTRALPCPSLSVTAAGKISLLLFLTLTTDSAVVSASAGPRLGAGQRRAGLVSLFVDSSPSPQRWPAGDSDAAGMWCRDLSNNTVWLRAALTCDGMRQCLDHSDETNCSSCRQNAWLCASGSQCIPDVSRCDGLDNCADGSDEDRERCMREPCPGGVGSFKCGDGVCVHISEQCDGDPQCPDGSDELDCCQPSQWQCPLNKSVCIAQESRCDGRWHCPGGEDERHCHHCADGAFLCNQADSSFCIDGSRRCDGREDCDGGEDEMACPFSGAYPMNQARHTRHQTSSDGGGCLGPPLHRLGAALPLLALHWLAG